jgi:integrase
MAWRQRNVRECRISAPGNRLNLFKSELPPLINFAVPDWVKEDLRTNPHQQFWQFHFRKDETKTHHEVRSILPRDLVPLLEEYLEHHRPKLLKRGDPGTLFITVQGKRFSKKRVTDLVSEVTLRYGGKRVTPHLLRDVFAFKWLEDHPEDYLTVSKVLWHQNIQTTLRIYGRRFDESHGLRRVEQWLEQRKLGLKNTAVSPMAGAA